MELLREFLAIMGDLPTYLNSWAGFFGPWIYVILFLIIFAETGLVITPFLPGDSLLFAIGALAATENATMEISWLCGILTVAAILGDVVNYSFGRYLGRRLFTRPDSKILNPEYLKRTQAFYERHGGKTIILARFIPIIRTYAPFVAGMAEMKYRQFAVYNVSGAIAWIVGFLYAGYHFGNIPAVKTNFHIVIVAIIVISALPAMIEILRARAAVAPASRE